MKNILIVFWHGIGDAIMATPTFRALRRRYPKNKIAIALQPRTFDSGLLNNCPYFDKIYKIDNPWLSRDIGRGLEKTRKQVKNISVKGNYHDLRWVNLKQNPRKREHKVFLIAKELGVELAGDTGYEAFPTLQEENHALKWLGRHNYPIGQYTFMHTDSSDLKKNISVGVFEQMVPEEFRRNVIVAGRDYDFSTHKIGFSVALLRYAQYLALVDSVFMHVADAIRKDINILVAVPEILEIVYPLHIDCQKIVRKQITMWDILKHKIDYNWRKLKSRF